MTVPPSPVATTTPAAVSAPPRPATTSPATPWRVGERARLLPRLLAVTADELDAASIPRRRCLLARLIDARDGEARRLRAGHWSASPLRLAALTEAISAETASLEDGADPADVSEPDPRTRRDRP